MFFLLFLLPQTMLMPGGPRIMPEALIGAGRSHGGWHFIEECSGGSVESGILREREVSIHVDRGRERACFVLPERANQGTHVVLPGRVFLLYFLEIVRTGTPLA